MTREEAIKEIKSWDFLDGKEIEAIHTLIPELIESEDEKIRKELIEFIQWSVDRHFMREDFHQAKRPSEWIAYLERQKEPIPIPDKFSGLKSLMLQYLQSASNLKNDVAIEYDTDLWGRKILGYVWKYSDEQKEPHFTKRSALFDKCVENCDPAVMKKVSDEVDKMLEKEQKPVKCELEDAFKYYTDAGITISCGDIVAKPKEQKPEPVFKVGDKIKLKSEPKYPYREIVDIKNGAYYFDEAVYLPFDNQDNWEKEQKPAEIDEYEIIKKHVTYDSLSSEINKRLKECGWYVTEKPIEWNANDKAFIKDCARILDENGYVASAERLLSMFPVKSTEWKEEDEEIWFTLITFFKGYLQKYPPLCKDEETQVNRILNWLNTTVKSFRLHHRYKPTEDQMKALKNISYGFYQNGDGPILRELYEQLKKL